MSNNQNPDTESLCNHLTRVDSDYGIRRILIATRTLAKKRAILKPARTGAGKNDLNERGSLFEGNKIKP